MNLRVVPSKTELRAYLAKGLTQQQIADAWEAKTGVRVSRSAIGMAIARYDLNSSRPRPRYDDTLPWEVRSEHTHHNDARMLRLEGRRRQGKSLSPKEERLLTQWRQLLDDLGAVVLYDPDTEKGFWWVPREDRDGADVIRRP